MLFSKITHMRIQSTLLLLPLSCLVLLASCGAPNTQDMGSNPNPNMSNQPGGDAGNQGWNHGPRSGSGGHFGSGARYGSGGMNSMMSQLSTDDQAVLQQMMNARKSGDTALATQLQTQLEQKYPNLHFGRRNGSGSHLP